MKSVKVGTQYKVTVIESQWGDFESTFVMTVDSMEKVNKIESIHSAWTIKSIEEIDRFELVK